MDELQLPVPQLKRWLKPNLTTDLFIGFVIQLILAGSSVAGSCEKVVVIKDDSCLYSYIECDSPIANADEVAVDVKRTIYKQSLDVKLGERYSYRV